MFHSGRKRSPSCPRSPFEEQQYHHADKRDQEKGDKNPGNNLFITGLAAETKEKDIENVFSNYGKIEKVSVMYDPHTLMSRGFAFVTFTDVQDAEAALNECSRGLEIHGKILVVDKARRGRARTPTPGVYRGPPKRDTRRMGDLHVGNHIGSGAVKHDYRARRHDRYHETRRQYYRDPSDGRRYSDHYDHRITRRTREQSLY